MKLTGPATVVSGRQRIGFRFAVDVAVSATGTLVYATGPGEGLGAMWGEEKTRDYLGKAGFAHVVTHKLDHDIQNNWYVVTPPAD